MFGPDLLIAPVVEKGCVKRKVYLPEGAVWKDACTGTIHEGGKTVEVDAPLERIPVFYKNLADLKLFEK